MYMLSSSCSLNDWSFRPVEIPYQLEHFTDGKRVKS